MGRVFLESCSLLRLNAIRLIQRPVIFRAICLVATRNDFHLLRAFEAEPEIEGADSEIQSSRLAYHAMIYASVRDFDRGHIITSHVRVSKRPATAGF